MASLRGAGTRRYTRRRRGSSQPAVPSSSTATLQSARRAPLASLGRATLLLTQSRVQHAHPSRHWAPRHPGTGYAWLPVVWLCALLWLTACTRPPCQATPHAHGPHARLHRMHTAPMPGYVACTRPPCQATSHAHGPHARLRHGPHARLRRMHAAPMPSYTACTRPPCQATSRGARSRSRAAAAAATCAPCSSAAARASTTSTRTSPPLRSAAARQMPRSRPPTRARAHAYSAVRDSGAFSPRPWRGRCSRGKGTPSCSPSSRCSRSSATARPAM